VLLKRACRWTLRVAVLFVFLASLARFAQLPLTQTLIICALVSLAAAVVLTAVWGLLHRWKWISESPWDEPRSTELSNFGAPRPLPPITEPAPVPTQPKLDSAAPPVAAAASFGSGNNEGHSPVGNFGLHGGTVSLDRGECQPPVVVTWTVSKAGP
jgi:hypothetical protein